MSQRLCSRKSLSFLDFVYVLSVPSNLDYSSIAQSTLVLSRHDSSLQLRSVFLLSRSSPSCIRLDIYVSIFRISSIHSPIRPSSSPPILTTFPSAISFNFYFNLPSSMYPRTPLLLPLIYSQLGFSAPTYPPTFVSAPRVTSSSSLRRGDCAWRGGNLEERKKRRMQRERTCAPSGIQPEESNKGYTKTGECREPG